jgi:ADP-heptose:LPS heptosyltransferase
VHFLVVKRGALGDVVRTAYFADALRRRLGDALRLSWLTAPASVPLIRFNPNIDDVWTSFAEARGVRFNRIFSLDDERDAIEGVMALAADSVTGAIAVDGGPAYSADAGAWFDMGLLSRFGKVRADELKRLNTRGHAEIFAEIFGVDSAHPVFYGSPRFEDWAARWLPEGSRYVGINCFAGGRWQSKELPAAEIPKLIEGVLGMNGAHDRKIILIGAGADQERNRQVAARFPAERVIVADTDDSVLRLAAVIGRLDLMVSSDSLAMHLAIGQGVPTVVFFAPTSAAEIDDFGLVTKVVSTGADYCSYRRDADNTSITAERLLHAIATRTEAAGPTLSAVQTL